MLPILNVNIYTSQSQGTQDLQKYLDKKLGANSIVDADIYYKGNNTTTVIRGEALEPILHQISNEKFWKAIEILGHDFGYKLDKLVVNGLGSEANPERLYEVLTK